MELRVRNSSCCTVSGCKNPTVAKTLCVKHYTRMYRNGTTEPNSIAVNRELRRNMDYLREDLCLKCQQVKPITEFYKSYKKRKQWCKQCTRAYSKTPEQRAKARARNLKKAYSISMGDYESLLEKQQGLCAICGTKDPGGKGVFVVDHNHKSGQVRGLLCSKCNVGIGCLQESPVIVSKAVEYLHKYANN